MQSGFSAVHNDPTMKNKMVESSGSPWLMALWDWQIRQENDDNDADDEGDDDDFNDNDDNLKTRKDQDDDRVFTGNEFHCRVI